MSGLPAMPAFRHPAPQQLDTAPTPSGTLTATAGGVLSVDGAPAPVGVDVAVDDTVDPASLGPWGCNAAANCVNPVVIQWAAPAPTDADPLHTVPVFACANHKGA